MIATLLCYFFYLFTRRTIVNKSKSGRQAIQVDRVIKYRPVSDHKANVSTLIFSKFLFNHNGMHTLCNTIHAHDILEWKSKSCISGYPCNLETSLKSLFFFSTDQIFYTIFSDSLLFGRTIQFNSMFSGLPIQSCNVPFPHRLNTKRKRKKKERELEKMRMLSKRCFSMHLKDINTITWRTS